MKLDLYVENVGRGKWTGGVIADGIVIAKHKKIFPTQELAEEAIFSQFQSAMGDEFTSLKVNYDGSLRKLTALEAN